MMSRIALTSGLVTDREPYDAERHLALGTAESPEVMANLEYDWYKEDEPHSAAIYAARAVFPYLLVGNVRSANKSYLLFTSRLTSSNKALGVQEVSSTSSDMRVYPSLPLLNFIGLLLLAIQRGSPDLFRQLAKHYAVHIKELGMWDEALANIGEQYFGIKIPKQGNPLFDMMGNMFFGGGGSPKPSGTPKPGTPKPGQQSKAAKKLDSPAPPTMDLD
jgi:golgi to ER traffic protein 4